MCDFYIGMLANQWTFNEVDELPIKRFMELNHYKQKKEYWKNQRKVTDKLRGI